LLERGEQLATLVDRFDRAGDAGRLVVVTGEAGAGKTALVQEFVTTHAAAAGARALTGRCDDLVAARPLGPLADIARDVAGPLHDALARGDQGAAFDAFLAELAPASGAPAVVVLEDLQWADEATLDLVRFVARRLDALSCLLLVTHRTDLSDTHPLRRVSGALVGPLVTRLHLPPLSLEAVRTLADGSGVDAESVHARTHGNPFFVVELLGSESGAVPITVRDTILARAAQLPGPARDALDAAAVLGREVAPELLVGVGDCSVDAVDECVRAGLLVGDGTRLAFRHDLAREAIDDALTPLRRRQLHSRALAALGEDGDIVRRAHHAVGSGDPSAVAELAARAGDHCVSLGARREAAALYGRALEHRSVMDDATRRHVLEARVETCKLVEELDAANSAAEELVAMHDDGSDELALGMWEIELFRMYRNEGRGSDAAPYLASAVRRLEAFGETRELAHAVAQAAGALMVSGRHAEAIAEARRAWELAEACGADDIVLDAMDSYGCSLAMSGQEDEGFRVLADALDRAKAAASYLNVVRTANNWASTLLITFDPRSALLVLEVGLTVAVEQDMTTWHNALLNTRSDARYRLGEWDDAVTDVETVLAADVMSECNRLCTVVRIGEVRTRRGDPDTWPALDEALTLATQFGDRQGLHPVRVARAEAAWFAGDVGRAREEVAAALPLWDRDPEAWMMGQLAVLARRVGVDWSPPVDVMVPPPFARWFAGDWRGAAAMWDERGCAYEAADALGDSDDVDDLRSALSRLRTLGARPRALQVERRLRSLGVRDLPRGPRATTRANAAGLTAREVEVASLLSRGLANSEIADALVLSPKTVDHHVTAVLSKLAVRSRRHVGAAAARAGIDL
jgi:DNA-binding CsgD family transcriptional regulator/tetratricopeptide (TPR) repeat protein